MMIPGVEGKGVVAGFPTPTPYVGNGTRYNPETDMPQKHDREKLRQSNIRLSSLGRPVRR